MEKRGLSTIVVTLIIILVSLVAVGIIWIVVRNVIQRGSEGVSMGQFTLDAKIKNVNLENNSNNVNLTVKRNPGEGQFTGLKFIFYDGRNSEVFTEAISLQELEEKRFNFHLNILNVSQLVSISIVPILNVNGKESIGNVLDKYTVRGSEQYQFICTPATCSALGYSCGTWANGTCSGNLNCGTCGSGYDCVAGNCVVQMGRVYYVDNSGSPPCSNSPSYGTEANPWCTIQYGISRISGGDNLIVKNGVYNESFTITGPSGNSTKSTEIKAYPGHTPKLLGLGVNTGRMKFSGVSYMKLSGFEVTNYNQGIWIEFSDHVTIENSNVHHIGQDIISIHSNSSYILIQNNIIHDSRQWQYNGEGLYVGTGSAGPLDNSNNVIIKNNVIYNTVDEAIELKAGTHDCTVEGNEIYNSSSSFGANVGIIEINEHTLGVQYYGSNPNHTIRNNIIHDSLGGSGIRAGTGSTIYNNIIYNIINSYYGIYVNNNAGDSYTRRIYHNTIDLPSSLAVYISSGTTDVRNNIGPSTSNNIITSDAYYVNKPTANYHLVSGSVPINLGVDLTAIVPFDFDGNSRLTNSPPDIGAYEYVSGGADTTPPVRSNGAPTGTLSSGTTQTTISLTTNEAATCRYSTSAGTAYSAMTNTFSTTGGTSHSRLITGLADGGSYNYYVKCIDGLGNANTNDYIINFNVASSGGNIINALSCSQADVQAAINSAADGDTVQVPAGTCVWSSSVAIAKEITLKGAGISQTKIIDGTDTSQEPLWIGAGQNGAIRVTGFSFNGETSSTWGIITVSGGPETNFRIDHNKFTNLTVRCIVVWSSYGLIDHNIFEAPYSRSVQSVSVFGNGADAWARPLSLGTQNAVYVEDNTFLYSYPNDGALDAYGGARYVFRHNIVNGTLIGHHGCDSGGYRAAHSWEVYENTFTKPTTGNIRLFHSRGGTGVIFNNTYTGNYGGMSLANYRSCASYSPWGMCDGTNPIDGNKETNGYNCQDQNGWTSTGIDDGTGPNQISAPIYAWGNILNGVPVGLGVAGNCPAELLHIQENRDFYNNMQKPGYTPYTYPHPLTLV